MLLLDGFGLGNQPEVNRQALGTTGALERCRFLGKLGSSEANAIRARMRVAACGPRSPAKLADVNPHDCISASVRIWATRVSLAIASSSLASSVLTPANVAGDVPGGLAVMRDSVAGLLSYVWRNSDTVKAERNGFARLAL